MATLAPPSSSSAQRSSSLLKVHDEIAIAASVVMTRLGSASVALVLGSGLSGFTSRLANTSSLPYTEIPHMPMTSVKGHAGKLVMGELPNARDPSKVIKVLCFAGRVHSYEGFNMEQVNFLCRLAAACGCSLYILTNSAGGAVPNMKPGSAMIIRDHIRWANTDPLRDASHDSRLCSPTFSPVGLYSDRLATVAKASAARLGQTLYEGIYCWTPGPTYETPAEVRAGIKMGAGAFGMSTVPEALASHAVGMEVFGLSLCTNIAAGLTDEKLIHDDVTRVAMEAGPNFEALLLDIMNEMVVLPSVPRFNSDLSPESRALCNDVDIGRELLHWSNATCIAPDVKVLMDRLKTNAQPVMALFSPASSSLNRVIQALEAPRVTPMSSLPILCEISLFASRKGRIVVGTLRTSPGVIVEPAVLTPTLIAIVEHPAAEGFRDYESQHLIAVLQHLGVRSVVQVVTSQPVDVNTTGGPGIFSVCADIVDRTQDRTSPVFDVAVASQFPGLNTAVSNLATVCICAFPGPSQPTLAERNVASMSSCDVYTCTSISPIYSAAQAGMQCTLLSQVGVNPTQPLIECVRDVMGGAVALPSTVSAGISCPIPRIQFRQEAPGDVGNAVRHLKEQLLALDAPASFAIVVDLSLCAVVSHISWDKSILVRDIPSWPSDGIHEQLLSIGEWNGTRVLCLHTLHRDEVRIDSIYDSTFAIRVFKGLGVRHLIRLGAIVSASSNLFTNAVAAITDHINMSGQNPLFNVNVAEFGPRFPDMSHVYEPVPGAACSTVCAYLPNLTVVSLRLAKLLGYTSACNTIVPDVIVARHSDLLVTALAWVYRSAHQQKGMVGPIYYAPELTCTAIIDLVDGIIGCK